MRLLGMLLLLVPLGFGMLRAASTGSDLRYLVSAGASTLGAALILRRPVRGPRAFGRILMALLVCALCAAAMAFAQGAQSVPAVAAVAIGFATCSTLGFALARRR